MCMSLKRIILYLTADKALLNIKRQDFWFKPQTCHNLLNSPYKATVKPGEKELPFECP